MAIFSCILFTLLTKSNSFSIAFFLMQNRIGLDRFGVALHWFDVIQRLQKLQAYFPCEQVAYPLSQRFCFDNFDLTITNQKKKSKKKESSPKFRSLAQLNNASLLSHVERKQTSTTRLTFFARDKAAIKNIIVLILDTRIKNHLR